MSFYERIVTRPRPFWLTIITSLLLLLAPIGAAALDGVLDQFLIQGNARPFFTAPVVIIYILAASHWMAKSDTDLLKAFRPLLLIDDEAFEQLRRNVAHISPVGEALALIVGALMGLGISLPWLKWLTTFWLRLYVPVSLSLMWSLLAWVIFSSLASTRLVTALHRQPLEVDILDTKPFEPMGRYSLVISLVFIGGVALGMVFGLDVRNIFAWQSWLIFLPLMCVPVLVFFLNMRPTHRLLVAEKKRELEAAARQIRRITALVRERVTRQESLGEIAGEYTAFVAYETRLRAASTWPYNTAMLRTLFFTIFVPLVIRGISALLFGQ
jgi:hypothetical protein